MARPVATHLPSFLFLTVVFQSTFRTWPHPVLASCLVRHWFIPALSPAFDNGLSLGWGPDTVGCNNGSPPDVSPPTFLFTGVANTAGALAGKGWLQAWLRGSLVLWFRSTIK